MRRHLPHAIAGQTVGLLGGSFDPPHAGHVHITEQALKRFGLDRVWWLVSPGNPLKSQGPAGLERRLDACRAVIGGNRRVTVSDAEARLGTRYTRATLVRLMALYPGVRFVWLMGADNLAGFHRWENWQAILASVPIGVLARPDNVVRAGLSPAARAWAWARLCSESAPLLARRRAPAWCLIGGPTLRLSSTEIRNRGDWVSTKR